MHYALINALKYLLIIKDKNSVICQYFTLILTNIGDWTKKLVN